MFSDGLQKDTASHSSPANNDPRMFKPGSGSLSSPADRPLRIRGLGLPLFGERDKAQEAGSVHWSQGHRSGILSSKSASNDISFRAGLGVGDDEPRSQSKNLSHSFPLRLTTDSLQQPTDGNSNGNNVNGFGSAQNVNGSIEGSDIQPVSVTNDGTHMDTTTAIPDLQPELRASVGSIANQEVEGDKAMTATKVITAAFTEEKNDDLDDDDDDNKQTGEQSVPQLQSSPQRQTTLFVTPSSDQEEEMGDDFEDLPEDSMQTVTPMEENVQEPPVALLPNTVTEANVVAPLELNTGTGTGTGTVTQATLNTIPHDTPELSTTSIPEFVPQQVALSSPVRESHYRNDQRRQDRISKKKLLDSSDRSMMKISYYEAKIAKLEQQISHYEKNDTFLKKSLRTVINDVMDQETRLASLYGKISYQNEASGQVHHIQELLVNNSLLVQSACSTISKVAKEGRKLIREREEMEKRRSEEENGSFKILNGRRRRRKITSPLYVADSQSDNDNSDEEDMEPFTSTALGATNWRRNSKQFQGTVRKLQEEIGNLKDQLQSFSKSKREGEKAESDRAERAANILRQLLRDLDDRIADYSSRNAALTEKITELSRLQSSAGTQSLFEESDYVKNLKEKTLCYNDEIKTLRTLLESRTNNMKLLLLRKDKKCSQLQNELKATLERLNAAKESERDATAKLTSLVNTAEQQRKSIISVIEQFRTAANKLQSSENNVKNLESVVQAQAEYIRNLQKFVRESSSPERARLLGGVGSLTVPPIISPGHYGVIQPNNGGHSAITNNNNNNNNNINIGNGNVNGNGIGIGNRPVGNGLAGLLTPSFNPSLVSRGSSEPSIGSTK